MKVKMTIPAGAKVVVTTEDGTKITNVAGIEVTPMFMEATEVANVITGQSVTDRGRVVDLFRLVASGGTGKIQRRGEAKPVQPAIDKKDSKSQGTSNEQA
jgi:hypothetical protein